MLWGVNLSGGEFNPSGTRGLNWDYTYPTRAEVDYYVSKGMDVIRLPFLWERVQSGQFGDLSGADLARITEIARYAGSKGLKVDLDVHNYGSGFGNLIGTPGTPDAAFADLWGKLAAHFKGDANVMFGLMNEPHVQSATQWLGSVNAAIDAIRATGATQTILVPGSYWDGAWTWVSSDNDTVIGAGVRDPLNNYAFEVHQYLDQWSSGTSTQVTSENIGVERLTAITQWAEQNGHQLFLGEFGAGSDPASLAALDKMLGYMAQHQDAWLGATIWGGGPWWGNYMFSVEPTGLGTPNVTDKPQIAILSAYASEAPVKPNATVHGTDSPDVLRGSVEQDTIQGWGGNDTIYGGRGPSDPKDAKDVVFGDQGDDTILGNGGDDALYGNAGRDVIYGGAGSLMGGPLR